MAAAAITTSMLPVLPLLSLACAPTPAPPPEPAVEEAPAARLAHDRHVEWRGTASGLGADVPAVVRVTPWDVKPAHFFSASHPDAERFRPAAEVEMWLDLETVDPLGVQHASHWTGQLGALPTRDGIELRLVAVPDDGPCAVDEAYAAAQASTFEVRRDASELVVQLLQAGACPGPTTVRTTR